MCVVNLDFVMFFFFKQKTAYEMRISDWSSDVCSSDLFVVSLLLQEAETGGAFEYAPAVDDASPEEIHSILDGASPKARIQKVGEIGRATCRERVCQAV